MKHSPSRDSSEKVYFLFSHNDDEFGVYPELNKQISESKKDIHILYLTTPKSPKLRKIREQESIKILLKLGIDKHNIHFLGREAAIFDGELDKNITIAFEAIIQLMMNEGLPEIIFSHAWEGGNKDHDASYIITASLAKKYNILSTSFQFSLYVNDNLPWIFYKFFTPLAINGKVISYKVSWLKRLEYFRYMLSYTSQTKVIIGLFPFYFFHFIFFGTQQLQRVSLDRVYEKPHSGKLLYERRGFGSYNQFSRNVKGFIEENISS